MSQDDTTPLQVQMATLVNTRQAKADLAVKDRTWNRLVAELGVVAAFWEKGPGGQKWWRPADIERVRVALEARQVPMLAAPAASTTHVVAAPALTYPEPAVLYNQLLTELQDRALRAEALVRAQDDELRILHQRLGAQRAQLDYLTRPRWWRLRPRWTRATERDTDACQLTARPAPVEA